MFPEYGGKIAVFNESGLFCCFSDRYGGVFQKIAEMIQSEFGQIRCDGVRMHFLLELDLYGSAR